MSDLFKAVQESLRTYKQRGVDLTNPMGVVVFDKHYPAIEKSLLIKTTANGGISKNCIAQHTIPLENGLRVAGWAAFGEHGTSLEHYLTRPYINVSESNPWSRYGWFRHEEQEIHDLNNSNGIYFRPSEQQALHEDVQKWSREPTHGWSHANNQNHVPMSPEQHREHQQNVRSSLITHPSKLTIFTHGMGGQAYEYDIPTEALTPYDSRDKYPDDESNEDETW